jgi:hypothetical protein
VGFGVKNNFPILFKGDGLLGAESTLPFPAQFHAVILIWDGAIPHPFRRLAE